MDGPSVNIKILQVVKELQQILVIGSFGLHTHGSFKTGIEKSEWDLKTAVKASFNILMILPPDATFKKT